MKYRADIDGLRAIAIISIIGFHAYPNIFKSGFIGVDIFFVISGYLITTIIFNDLENGKFRFKDFYIRRIRRIFPALIVILLFVIIFGWFFLLADEYQQLGKHVLAGSTFISNYIFLNESGYFDTAAEKKILLHLWSLSIEWQFYLIWPILLYYLWKKNNILFGLLALILISFQLNILIIKTNSYHAFFLSQTRFWELLIGSLTSYILLKNPRLVSQDFKFKNNALIVNFINLLSKLKPIVGIGLIAISFFIINKDLNFPGWWSALPVIGVAIVILSREDNFFNKFILSHPLLVWVGLISFPLYLWHWPILSLAKLLWGKELSFLGILVCIILIVILAIFTYYLIEKPIQQTKNYYIKYILIVLMVIIAIFGYIIKIQKGFSYRINSNEVLNQFDWNKSYNSSKECLEKYPGDDYCNISNILIPPDVAIIGDSHSNHFYWGLSEFYKKKGKNLLNMGAGGCPPLIGIDMSGPHTSPNCYSRMNPIFNSILESNKIGIVYISFWHAAYFANNLIYTDKMGSIYAKNNYEFFLNAFSRTINLFQERGKRVIIIYDLPDLSRDIKECFIKRPINFKKECKLDNSIFIRDFDDYNKLINEVKLRNNVEIFYTHHYIPGNFPISDSGIPNYRDHSHLSINGSLFFSDKFFD